MLEPSLAQKVEAEGNSWPSPKEEKYFQNYLSLQISKQYIQELLGLIPQLPECAKLANSGQDFWCAARGHLT